ncbi:ABC transporter ATP-binding protein [Bradyrhizobium jicamae]|uniref:ABC transporter ATP-binding protein n=1 Tax=Bradyrhizobium jicamae TaxID=280332 RepID=UPI00201289FA|nr:ABC transporter ATP-binding protein [Bradyrhizobium jicamae]
MTGGRQRYALEFEAVRKSFGALAVLNGVTLAIKPGERHGLIGVNGAGKSTLFALAAGVLKPTGGVIRVFGADVAGLAAHERVRLGLRRTFQTSNVVGNLSVLDNAALAVLGASAERLSVRRRLTSSARTEARALISRLGLASVAGRGADTLSHGEKRQLEIACALAGNPKIILLDEPAAGLSAAERAELREILTGLDCTLTLVMIEHDMEFALGFSDRVTLLHNGRVVAQGTSAEISRNADVHAIYMGAYNGS